MAVILAVIAVIAACSHQPPHARAGSAPATVAFTHVTVLPMDSERVLSDQTVIVRGGAIAAVGPAATTAGPADATVVDGHGRYLMPGLTDMHVHVVSPTEFLSDLVWGVTTIGLYSGDPETLRWRAAVEQGTLTGPTLYTSGPITDGAPPTDPDNLEVATPAEAKVVAYAHKHAGYDYIKVYNNYKLDVYRALLAEAKAQGITVVGHIVRAVGAEETLSGGQAVIAHGEEYYYTYFAYHPDTAKIPAIVAATRAAGAWVVAMLSSTPFILNSVANVDSILSYPEARYLPPAAYDDWRPENNGYLHRADPAAFVARNRTMGAFLPVLIKAMSDAHVKLLVGTDAASVNFPGWAVHDELRELVTAGLTPYQALRVATYNAGAFVAERIRSGDHFGTVAPGMRADLILLSANPMSDIVNVDSIVGVMARGRWWTVGELRRQRDRATAEYTALEAMAANFDSLLAKADAPGARAVFDAAVARDPDHRPFSMYPLQQACDKLRAHDPKVALEFCRMNVQLYPDRFSTHNELARALLTAGDTVAARSEFAVSLRVAPGNDAAVRMLDSLAQK